MPVGRPSITTPNRLELRLIQQTIQNVEQRFRAVEASLVSFEATVTARAESSASTVAGIQAALREIRVILNAIQSLPPISDGPAVDGDVLTWSDENGEYIPEAPASGGGVLPVVTGEIPPVFVYGPDGSLVYGPVVEA